MRVIDYQMNFFLLSSQMQSKLEQLQWSEQRQAGHLAGNVTAGVTVPPLTHPSLCPCFMQIIPGRLSEPRTGQPIPLLSSSLRRGPPGRSHLQHRQIPQQAVFLPGRRPFLPAGRRRHHRRGDPIRRQARAPGDPAGRSHRHCRRYLHFPAAPARTETEFGGGSWDSGGEQFALDQKPSKGH